MAAFRADFLADAPAHIRGTSLWAWQRDMDESRAAAERARTTPYPAQARVARANAAFWLNYAGVRRRAMARVLACPFARRGLVSPR